MLKKFLILLTGLVVAGTVAATVFLNRIGINPALWLSAPESSQIDTTAHPDNIAIKLDKRLKGFSQITDFQFFPGSDQELLVLQKSGEMFLVNMVKGEKQQVLELDVLTRSEQGLLGVAIHPDYPETPCIYLNSVVDKNGQDTSRVSEWCSEESKHSWKRNKILLELAQPYGNHNAGHLIFDQAGLLYIPWGDGGSRADPHNHALNLQSLLGKILRINPEAGNANKPYSIPEDNPFTNQEKVPDEIYAYGLRNPWKLAFDPSGRLIAADVGQDKWEEVTFIEAGGNHGWNQIEALHCFKKNCSAENTVLPFIEYGHDVGRSVTGGYVYRSKEIPELFNKYIYGDFVTGRLWAAELPKAGKMLKAQLNHSGNAETHTKVYPLGQWPLLISSFARDSSGNIYLADFARGQIFRFMPADALNTEEKE